MSLLAPTDFTGTYNVTVNEFTTTTLQSYIDKFEKPYLVELFGADMYADFIADLNPTPAVPTSIPTDAKFTAVFDAFDIDDGDIHSSEGIKEMLKGLIYFEWVRDGNVTINTTGATKGLYSNSERARIVETRALTNYNAAVETAQQIRWYILNNPNNYDYDNYNGKCFDFTTWL